MAAARGNDFPSGDEGLPRGEHSRRAGWAPYCQWTNGEKLGVEQLEEEADKTESGRHASRVKGVWLDSTMMPPHVDPLRQQRTHGRWTTSARAICGRGAMHGRGAGIGEHNQESPRKGRCPVWGITLLQSRAEPS